MMDNVNFYKIIRLHYFSILIKVMMGGAEDVI